MLITIIVFVVMRIVAGDPALAILSEGGLSSPRRSFLAARAIGASGPRVSSDTCCPT